MDLVWQKTEDLTWDENGARENGAWNYKVPMDKVLPKIRNITLNPEVPDFENGQLCTKADHKNVLATLTQIYYSCESKKTEK